MCDEGWEEFGIRIGPFGFGAGRRASAIRYTRTETSHILRIRIAPEVRKEEIKARLVQPGWLEIEWPRSAGEEIPIE